MLNLKIKTVFSSRFAKSECRAPLYRCRFQDSLLAPSLRDERSLINFSLIKELPISKFQFPISNLAPDSYRDSKFQSPSR